MLQLCKDGKSQLLPSTLLRPGLLFLLLSSVFQAS